MGDNANANWEWHNTTVGKGYQVAYFAIIIPFYSMKCFNFTHEQAKGVQRQRVAHAEAVKIVDMRGPTNVPKTDDKKRKIDDDETYSPYSTTKISKSEKSKKEKKNKKEKKHKKEKKEKKEKKSKKDKQEHDKKAPNDSDIAPSGDTRTERFNPLLQLFAASISDQTRFFVTAPSR